MSGWTTLEDARVIMTTDKAILAVVSDGGEKWIPRSVCQDGDHIEKGDFDVVVKTWWADRENLA